MLLNVRKLFPKYNLSFAGVVHVGANVGEERKIYKELGIFRQAWFEANPALYPQLVKNLAGNPLAIATEAAVGANDDQGLVPLYIADNGGQSSSLLIPKGHLEKHPDVTFPDTKWVPIGTLDRLLHIIDFDPKGCLLNVDVQGGELDVFKGAAESLSKFKAIYTELNQEELYAGCALVDQIDTYLGERGFVRVETKWTDRGWGEGLYIKK